MRKTSDKPLHDAETRWYEAGILALQAEERKHVAEGAYYSEDTLRLVHERMERDTLDRGRRCYDFIGEVTDKSGADVIATLSDWSTENRRRILLRLFSPGGDVVAGLAVYDFVKQLQAAGIPVDTAALGWAASMATVLLQAGETRFVAFNSFVLIHEARTYYEEPFMEKISDTEQRVLFGRMLEDRCTRILCERSAFTTQELADHPMVKGHQDWWIPAQEAIELGFADEIY